MVSKAAAFILVFGFHLATWARATSCEKGDAFWGPFTDAQNLCSLDTYKKGKKSRDVQAYTKSGKEWQKKLKRKEEETKAQMNTVGNQVSSKNAKEATSASAELLHQNAEFYKTRLDGCKAAKKELSKVIKKCPKLQQRYKSKLQNFEDMSKHFQDTIHSSHQQAETARWATQQDLSSDPNRLAGQAGADGTQSGKASPEIESQRKRDSGIRHLSGGSRADSNGGHASYLGQPEYGDGNSAYLEEIKNGGYHRGPEDSPYAYGAVVRDLNGNVEVMNPRGDEHLGSGAYAGRNQGSGHPNYPNYQMDNSSQRVTKVKQTICENGGYYQSQTDVDNFVKDHSRGDIQIPRLTIAEYSNILSGCSESY